MHAIVHRAAYILGSLCRRVMYEGLSMQTLTHFVAEDATEIGLSFEQRLPKLKQKVET